MEQIRHGVILEVPYSEKNEAKDLGAWWDPEMKKWFVPAGTDPAPFSKWIQGGVKAAREPDGDSSHSDAGV